MLTGRDEVVIVDFGLAKLAGELSLTKSGSTLGTPHYMSPEQAHGEKIDQRTDLWSLGVVLYEMLGGRKPFRGAADAAVVRSILDDEPSPLEELRPEAPPELGAIVAKALEKDAAKRYQRAGEFLADLKGLQDQLSEREGLTEAAPSVPPTRRRLYLAPVLVAAALFVVTVGVMWSLRSGFVKGPVETEPPRIAVLPFENLGDPDDEYFADGMTEEITSRLAVVRGLRVISRTSAMQYKGNRTPLKQIGEELGVDYVLEGSVRWAKSGDTSRVRITPQLIQVSDDTHLWADTYDRVIDDIFEIQAEIASIVIEGLGVTLAASEQQRLKSLPTESIEAYQAYLRGMQLKSKPEASRQHLEEAAQSLEGATELDPQFASAFAELSEIHAFMYFYNYDLSAGRKKAARDALERAAALAGETPEITAMRGRYHYLIERNYPAALRNLEAAARGLPNDSRVLLFRANAYRRMGRFQESLETSLRAFTLSPRESLLALENAFTFFWMRRYAEAMQHFNISIELDPDQELSYTWKVYTVLHQSGDTEAASRLIQSIPVALSNKQGFFAPAMFDFLWLDRDFAGALRALSGDEPEWLEFQTYSFPVDLLRAQAHEALGNHRDAEKLFESARRTLEQRISQAEDDHRLFSSLARAYAGLGRSREAETAAERAVEILPLSKDAYVGAFPLWGLAVVHANGGDHAKASALLETLLSEPSPVSVPLLELDARFDPLRDHPRFQELLEKYDTN
jgi:TolB-like protein/Tfp pilus assembly protein PilF